MTRFTISEKGVQAIYSPAAAQLLQKLGDIHINRASHVEPGSNLSPAAVEHLRAAGRWETTSHNQWFADMTPTTRDIVILGPFSTNTTALAAELAFLKEKMQNG